MTFGPVQVQQGMSVVDTRGSDIGVVTEADQEQFVVDCGERGLARLSYGAVRAIVGEQVVLDTGPDLDRSV